MTLDTEANLQGEFYHACRLIGLTVSLEVKTPAGRHDALVLDEGRTMVLAIVEVKNSAVSFTNGITNQIRRYKTLGVPVYGLTRRNCAHRLAATIKRNHVFPNGVLLTKIATMENVRLKLRLERRARENLLN